MRIGAATCALMACATISARAQTASPAAAVAGPPPAPSTPAWRLPAGTPIEVELTEPVSSTTAKRGQRFGIRLAGPLTVDGRTLPAGGLGYGEVVDAAPAGVMGRPGKLVLVARSIDLGGVRLPLRGFSLAATGHDVSKPVTTVAALPYVGLVAIVMTGGNVSYPSGVHALVKLAQDVEIPGDDPATPDAHPSSTTDKGTP